ncbi:MAG: M3 family metallopeptidase [Pirellulaceae bacterium]|nr:M3 family metallopeptidase [Pirellulaceae bacterium]MDG2102635.1 M3 family metallopeptidase [Pirellulaceae bacterium]
MKLLDSTNRLLIPLVGLGLLATSSITNAQENTVNRGENSVLLKEWDGPYGGVPPWKSIRIDDFQRAFDAAIAMSTADIDAIANNPEPATFANTIIPMEKSGQALDRLDRLFGVHQSNLNVGAIPDIEKAVMPLLSKHADSITQNEKLFQRIADIYEGDEMKSLNEAQQRLVEKQYKDFVRRGAKLSTEEKAKLSAINTRLAGLFTQFSQNVLADEGGPFTEVADESGLQGLPPSVVDAMAAAAAERDETDAKWVVNNTRSSMEPVLTYSQDRGLREQVWRTYYNRGDNGDTQDNNEIIAAILKLRAERAKLLGYETHAHWRLEPQMAKTPENAMNLMLQIWPKAVARVKEEVADMQAIADAEGSQITIEPWDYRYYAEKVRKAKYDLDFNDVKPYLQMEKLREGMMWAAGQLYGFEFEQITDVPVYHPDVRVWKVTRGDELVGLWYFDPYARRGKRSGAWMNAYRPQENIDEVIAPIVSNNSNFVKGKPGEPVLISWDDAVTMFHEFGHALHGLCSDCNYPTQSGTSVARDYVEFPSQLNEHWLSTPEVLANFAVHYQTGEPIPKELLDKIEKASTFNQGFQTVEYLASALIDMKLHLAGDVTIDPDQFERDTLAELGMPKEIVMRHRTPQFNHIFASDGYSAGYYSYLWSDALTADAAEVFEDSGTYYDKEVAKSLYDNIFSVGDTIDPAEGFRRFRGRDVDTKALLRKRGFPIDEK